MELNTALKWPEAPAWSLIVGDLGRWLILMGLAAFIASILSWSVAPFKPTIERVGKVTFSVGAICVIGSIVCLGTLFVNEQFQYSSVQASIQAGLPIKYKIASIWSHQEGSFLLWGVTSSIFALLATRGSGHYRRWFTISYATFLACLCGILAYETPFKLTLTHGKALIPPDGAGLTPSLQNYWVVIHPPTIFTGFGSLTVMYCFAIAAMLTGNKTDWVKMVRPWALLSLSILGLGLCMGGFWAYETLGWGGFWAWDPVENVSFVPWILTAALTHGLIVQASKGRWGPTNVLLGGLPFLAFVYGTFLTRSGLYADVSVHSFAQMDKSALVILRYFLIASVLTFAAIWVFKGFKGPVPSDNESGVDREGLYRFGMLLVGSIGLFTAIGMSVPLLMFMIGKQAKVVEERLYHQILVWPFVPLLIFMAIAPFATWRSMPWRQLLNRLLNVLSFTVMLTGIAYYIFRHPVIGVHAQGNETIGFPFGKEVPGMLWITALFALCVFAALANLWRIADVFKRAKMSTGGFVAHLGVATLMAGMILSRGFEQKETAFVQASTPGRALDYTIAFKKFEGKDITDRDYKVLFNVSHINPDGTETNFEARPGLYYMFSDQEQPKAMTWPHIQHQFSHDIYFALHDPVTDVWKDPVSLKPGESHVENNVRVTYEKMTMVGPPGKIGTKFGAMLRVRTQRGEFHSNPTLVMTESGLVPVLASVDRDLNSSMVGMNAGDRSVLVQIHYAEPVFPIDLFYKPMPVLVWVGAGILTLGGLLSAWYRRRPRSSSPLPKKEVDKDATPEEDAVAPVA